MSNKTLVILAGIAVILLLILFGNDLLETLGITNRSEDRIFSASVKPETVNEITLKQSDGTQVRLFKTPNGWTVNDFEGSVDIEIFVENLANLMSSSLASRSEDKFDLFEVTEDKAAQVTLTQTDGTQHSILVGKVASTPNSFYVRKPGELAVYTAYGSIRGQILQSVDDWREKVLLQINETQVTSLDVTNGNNSYTMSKYDDTAWELKYRNVSTLVSDSAKNRIFTTLLRLEAQGFDGSATPASIQSTSDAKLTISGASEGETYTLWFKKQDSQWQVSISNSGYVYTFAEHAFQYILTDPATMHADS